MELGLVSIIMPTYNRAYIINEAIRSVLEQTYKHFELIIVDDGSSDDTEAVVNNYNDNRIIYQSYKPNKGGNHARNIGLKMARGEYISFLDSDNKWDKNFLKKQVGNIFRTKADISFCRVCVYDKENGKKDIIPPKSSKLLQGNGLINMYDFQRSIIEANCIDTNVVCIKRWCIEANVGFNEKMTRLQDWEYFLRLIVSNKCKVSFVPDVLVYSSLQKDSIRFKKDLAANFLFIFEKWLPMYKSYGLIEKQCNLIMRINKTLDGRDVRQDVLAGLLRFLPENVIINELNSLGIKSKNLKIAKEIRHRSIKLGLCKSIMKTSNCRSLAIYGGKNAFVKRYVFIPNELLRMASLIISEEISIIGRCYGGIPVVRIESLINSNKKFFIILLDEDDVIKKAIYKLGYIEDVDYVKLVN